MGAIEGNRPVRDNDWEQIKRGGEKAIQNWIDGQLKGRSCTAVMIGSKTAGRKWIKYEIEKSWNNGKGVFGIYVHNLLDKDRKKSVKGKNPFTDFTMNRDEKKLSSIVKAYDPPYSKSTSVYNHIKDNIADWADEAVSIGANY